MREPEKEIAELRQALLRANQDVEKLLRVKTEFLSIVSHELRTPMASIKEGVSVVLDGVSGPISESQKEFLTIARNNIDRLTNIISSILDSSKLDSGNFAMRKKKTDINEVIKNICSKIKGMVEKKNLKLDLELLDVEPTWLDPDRIGQVLKNLIHNAVVFNKEKGRIKISSEMGSIDGQRVAKIVIEDTGIGIPEEDFSRLFKQFSPLDTSTTRRYGGLGLGLSISRGIIALHGGNIWVESEKDIGSRFIFTLPIYKDDSGSGNKEEYMDKKKILLVDDEDDLRKMVKFRLEAEGYEVIEATDGQEGLDKARSIKPDLMILDLMIPKMDGFKVCRMLKLDQKYKDIPIIMFTARAQKKGEELAVQMCSADAYITKPFEAEVLLEKIKELLKIASFTCKKEDGIWKKRRSW